MTDQITDEEILKSLDFVAGMQVDDATTKPTFWNITKLEQRPSLEHIVQSRDKCTDYIQESRYIEPDHPTKQSRSLSAYYIPYRMVENESVKCDNCCSNDEEQMTL